MRGIRGFAVLAVSGCALVVAGSAGADRPGPPAVPWTGGAEDKPAPAISPASPSAPAGYKIVSSGPLTNFAGSENYGSAACPAGKYAWGGGLYSYTGSTGHDVNSSYPFSNGEGWQGYIHNSDGVDHAFEVIAVCAKQPPGYQIVKKTFPNPAGLQSSGAAYCPSSKHVLGGGVFSSSSNLDVNANSSYPVDSPKKSGWVGDVSNGSSGDASMTTYAICATRPGLAGYEVVVQRYGPHRAGSQGGGPVYCTGSKVSVGGGVLSSGKDTPVTINSTYPLPGGWGIWENNESTLDQNFSVYAICVS